MFKLNDFVQLFNFQIISVNILITFNTYVSTSQFKFQTLRTFKCNKKKQDVDNLKIKMNGYL